MKNVFFALVFMLVGTMAFASSNEVETVSENVIVENSTLIPTESEATLAVIPVETSCGQTAFVAYGENSTIWDVLIEVIEIDVFVCGDESPFS